MYSRSKFCPQKTPILTELAPLFHPIKSKTKTSQNSLARVFTRFAPAACIFSEFSWLAHWNAYVIVIGPLECVWPLWLAYWNVCGLCDWPTGMSVLWPLWFAHWYVCVLRDWLTGMSVAFVIGALECLCSLWLTRVSTLVLVWWHSDEDRCVTLNNEKQIYYTTLYVLSHSSIIQLIDRIDNEILDCAIGSPRTY